MTVQIAITTGMLTDRELVELSLWFGLLCWVVLMLMVLSDDGDDDMDCP